MKKFILITFLFLFESVVQAKVYYSDYGEYSIYSENEVLSSDIIQVDTINKYQLYRENIIFDYLENSEYDATGKTKVLETEWTEDYNLIDDSKEIQMCYKYETMSIKEYNYLLIDNQSEFNLIIKKFKLSTLSGEVILERSNIKLFDFSKYHIALNEYGYKFDEIKLEAIFEKEDPAKEGEISLGYYLNVRDDATNLNNKVREVKKNSNILEDSIEDFSIYAIYTDKCYDVKPSNDRNYKTYYRNIINLNEYKVINREYIDKYEIEAIDGYLIDKEKVKKYYRYKTRDKVEISDELIIDSNDVTLDSFIISTTIPLENIKITSDVDYTKNGMYKVNYILPFMTVTKDVKVNITNNLVDTINKQVQYINELKNGVEVANYAVDKKNLEIKELILDGENKVNGILEELNVCYSEKNNLKSSQIILDDNTKTNGSKKKYIIILVFLISLLIILRKYIHKKII